MRYNQAFKQKVIKEIEEGKLSISQARELYDIGGGSTIQTWMKKLGKTHLLQKVVKVELKGEVSKLKSKLKQTVKEKKELESALAQAHLKIMSLEKMLEIAGREYGEDFKKKYDTKALKK